MTTTPHTTAASESAAGIAVLEEMRAFEVRWRATVAGYSDEHGDIRPESYPAYDEARADHGGDLADRLENWIDRLAAALEAPPQP